MNQFSFSFSSFYFKSMWLCFSQWTSEVFKIIVNWYRVAVSNNKSTKWVPYFLCLFFYFFVKLIVACILGVIYVREDNDECISYDYRACMDYMDPDVRCPKKAVN